MCFDARQPLRQEDVRNQRPDLFGLVTRRRCAHCREPGQLSRQRIIPVHQPIRCHAGGSHHQEPAQRRAVGLLTITFCERNDFFENTPGPLCALRQWNYDDQRFATLRMEDFGDRIDLAFRNALGSVADQYEWPDAAEFTFSAFSGGRQPGQIDENSPYRSGHPDTWRRELPKAGILYIREHYRGLLERFYPEALLD
jgi:hypothetical protein